MLLQASRSPLSQQSSRAVGWLALAAQDGQLRMAAVSRPPDGGLPRLAWLHSAGLQADLADCLHRSRRLPPRGAWPVAMLLERGQYQVMPAEAPDVPPEDWRDALRWRLKEQLEFPAHDAAIDVLPLPAQAGLRARHSVFTVAAPSAALRTLSRAAEDAGWRCDAFEVAETALRQLSGRLASPGRGHALLHLGPTHATLVITLSGGLLQSRQIEVSGDALTGDDPTARAQALERAGLELQRTLDGFDRVHSQVVLERLDVLPGPGAVAFADYVRELVYVPVRLAEPAAVLDLSALPPGTVLDAHWLVIGAALRRLPDPAAATAAPQADADLQLPPPDAALDTGPSGRWRLNARLLGLGALAFLGLTWLGAAALDAAAGWRQAEATRLAAPRPASGGDAAASAELDRLLGERDRLQALAADQLRVRAQLDEQLRRGTAGPSPYFAALSRQAQAQVWITGFRVSADGAALVLEGRMRDASALPPYLQRLNQEPAFRGRQFGRLQLTQADEATAFSLASGASAAPAGAKVRP